MIHIQGFSSPGNNMWIPGSIEHTIYHAMSTSPDHFSFPTETDLKFTVECRKRILTNANAMNRSHAQFEVFARSRCNPRYWLRTRTGGFQLRSGVSPAAAIEDIQVNSSQYAFECATAMMIILYQSVLHMIGPQMFDRLYTDLYLYSWEADPDLGLSADHTASIIPGDVVYFHNPDFYPKTSPWRGENAIAMGNSIFFGHGIGMRKAEEIVHILNQHRRRGSMRSAYLMSTATRLDFVRIASSINGLSRSAVSKIPSPIVHHNQSSISYDMYKRKKLP
ncbi:protein-glutamine gamma-glutamyltransferase [Alteribacillus iranensis]|uniref:Protein-glutamine gamma-glutamyltransferase n=1 Tax=Alteribacillus iranensis TaxID=930128 RepID=A0A1I2E2T0_9BACI|nr:protein-glutamine gamma-glutamyltransferase [Alteribacillus iranensis]SFE86997.1 protein-glutamine gamma-glutamyltransferase [Alteribacillus iranensis]